MILLERAKKINQSYIGLVCFSSIEVSLCVILHDKILVQVEKV